MFKTIAIAAALLGVPAFSQTLTFGVGPSTDDNSSVVGAFYNHEFEGSFLAGVGVVGLFGEERAVRPSFDFGTKQGRVALFGTVVPEAKFATHKDDLDHSVGGGINVYFKRVVIGARATNSFVLFTIGRSW